MRDLFTTDDTTTTGPVATMDRDEIARLTQRFANATKLDRRRVKHALNEVMVEHGEATDNATQVGTRVPRTVVAALDAAATTYDTSVSALIRDAVLHYIQHELPKRPSPHRVVIRRDQRTRTECE